MFVSLDEDLMLLQYYLFTVLYYSTPIFAHTESDMLLVQLLLVHQFVYAS